MSRVADSLHHMLVLHHDYPSAASLRAVLLVDRAVSDPDRVVHHGVDVLGLATTVPAMLDDIADWERHHEALAVLGWEVARPDRHPATLGAHMVARMCPDPGVARTWRLACYRTHWLERRDLGDREVLVDLARSVGLDGAEVAARLGDRMEVATVRRQMLQARENGVGGVPVLDVDGTKVSPFMSPDDLHDLASL